MSIEELKQEIDNLSKEILRMEKQIEKMEDSGVYKPNLYDELEELYAKKEKLDSDYLAALENK